MTVLLTIGHTAVTLGVVLLIGALGRAVARPLRQPGVIGETVLGLLVGPLAVALLGADTFHLLLPDDVRDVLRQIATGSLVLYLVGVAHHMRHTAGRSRGRTTGLVAVGALLPALAAGFLLAGWVLVEGDPAVRGSAPTAAFVLMVATSLAITAVPVMARILAERGMTGTPAGRIALVSAVVTDAVCWLVLSVAVALHSGNLNGFLQSIGLLSGIGLFAVVTGRVLRTAVARRVCARAPKTAAVTLGAVILAVTLSGERLGLPAMISAAAIGLAVPTGEPAPVVGTLHRVGRLFVPTFFVVTGLAVLTTDLGATPWALFAIATVLAVGGKVAGGYLGARLGGQSPATAARIGVLMNTRGLTELIVLQVGYGTGILTTPMFLALIVMAVVTTMATGPLLMLIDHREIAGVPPSRPALGSDTR